MKKNNLNHTFILLAYKESPYIEECIRSILNQTVRSRVYISTSTPSFFLDEISMRYNVPIVINKKAGNGIAYDWNFAYQLCETKFLTLVHQDDVYLPVYTESCLSEAEKNNKGLIYFTDYIELHHNILKKHGLLVIIKRLILLLFYLFNNKISDLNKKKLVLSFGNPICCPTIMYNKKQIGGFSFNSDYSMNLDWEANLRIAEMEGNFVYIKKKLVIRRIHVDSESTKTLQNRQRNLEDKIMYEKIWPKLPAIILMGLYSLSYKLNDQ